MDVATARNIHINKFGLKEIMEIIVIFVPLALFLSAYIVLDLDLP
jgi:hypothetical protein